MNKKTEADTPRREIAAKVVTAKRGYFVPQHLKEVEAVDLIDVDKQLKKQEEVGDDNS